MGEQCKRENFPEFSQERGKENSSDGETLEQIHCEAC